MFIEGTLVGEIESKKRIMTIGESRLVYSQLLSPTTHVLRRLDPISSRLEVAIGITTNLVFTVPHQTTAQIPRRTL